MEENIQTTEDKIPTLNEVLEYAKHNNDNIMLNIIYDSYIRLAAEYQNYRNRSISDREMDRVNAKVSSIQDILELSDIFDIMGKTLVKANDTEQQIVNKYISPIINKIESIVEYNGLKPISNDMFDSDIHECISTVYMDKEPGTIIDVISKGYMYNDKLIRPSKVIVQA